MAAVERRQAGEETDGRRARSVRARRLIAESLLALIEGGDLQPTAPRVAAKAGVSLRTVFHHFADMESVLAATIALQAERVAPSFEPIARDLAFSERLEALVARRARLYDRIAPVRRSALLLEHSSPAVAEVLRNVRALKRMEVAVLFEAEISRRPAELRADVAAAAGAAASFSAWEDLRAHQALGPERARSVLRRTLAALLGDRIQSW